MMMKYVILLLFCLINLCNLGRGQESNYQISEEPEWINPIIPRYKTPIEDKSTSGYYYLLVNRQNNIIEKHGYWHYAVKILNADGLREISNLSFNYDPTFQELKIHKIDVKKGGQVTNQLDSSLIQVIQREPSMDRHVYDGRLTAIIELVDVQIGDIVEYSYSIKGYNSIFGEHYSDKIILQYSVPIEHLYVRLLIPIDKTLQFKYYNGATHPDIQNSLKSKSYVWQKKNVP